MGNLLDKCRQSSEKKFIEKEVRDNCIVVFAKSTCPYCQMAKEVFDKYKVPYKAIDLDFRLDEAQLQAELGRKTTARTVPRVFINGVCIGGADETLKLEQAGKLYELIKACDLSTVCRGFCRQKHSKHLDEHMINICSEFCRRNNSSQRR